MVKEVKKNKTRISRTFLNVFQVVLMMELRDFFGSMDYITNGRVISHNQVCDTLAKVISMKFMLIVITTMGAMGHDPKTIEMRIPQEDREECLKSAMTFELKLPVAGIVMSMKSRCEPKKDEEEPEVKQVGA